MISVSTNSTKAPWRASEISTVGWSFNNTALPTLSAVENVQIPLELAGRRDSEQVALNGWTGWLADRADHLPTRLSGGEQQQVAIARPDC